MAHLPTEERLTTGDSRQRDTKWASRRGEKNQRTLFQTVTKDRTKGTVTSLQTELSEVDVLLSEGEKQSRIQVADDHLVPPVSAPL